ncbi:unnamed protein product [Lactuca saligna]|uniref:non-specific serine/threonine protein kinase n=1 Tax=Lactuca saligna TaxID=75948 RepID=A0AA35YLQ0_LACSI|nr:unnamed protein product [Lactuca saligna]
MGFDQEEGRYVAWNQVKLRSFGGDPSVLKRLFSEIKLLQTLENENIIVLYSFWRDTKNSTLNFIREACASVSVSFAATYFNGSQFRPLIPLLEAMPKELGASLHDTLNLITGVFYGKYHILCPHVVHRARVRHYHAPPPWLTPNEDAADEQTTEGSSDHFPTFDLALLLLGLVGCFHVSNLCPCLPIKKPKRGGGRGVSATFRRLDVLQWLWDSKGYLKCLIFSF